MLPMDRKRWVERVAAGSVFYTGLTKDNATERLELLLKNASTYVDFEDVFAKNNMCLRIDVMTEEQHRHIFNAREAEYNKWPKTCTYPDTRPIANKYEERDDN